MESNRSNYLNKPLAPCYYCKSGKTNIAEQDWWMAPQPVLGHDSEKPFEKHCVGDAIPKLKTPTKKQSSLTWNI